MNILFLTSAAPENSGFSTSEKRPPLGLGILIAILKKDGHKIYFSDEYLEPSNILESSFLREKLIDFVCIYTNTICYQSTLKMLDTLYGKLSNDEWKGKIILGGPHTSTGAEEIPDFVDHIVIGEGEIALPELIKSKITDRIVYGEKVIDLDALPMPAWEEFIHRPYNWSHSWHDAYPIYMMNTSRGCPFNCQFCSVKSIWGKTYRFMSAERVVEDILFMIKYYGAKGIYFREDHFTLNKKRTVDFCELLLKKDIKIDWFCETRVDSLDDYEYQKLMKDAGCRVYYIGVESGSQRMLDFYQKGETVEQFIRAFDIARKTGIKTYASFIVGFPTETDKDREETLTLKNRIKPDYMNDNIFVGIPGSELYDLIKNEKLYEYEDENHILYPIGYSKNVKKYYRNNPYYKVNSSNRLHKWHTSLCRIIKRPES